MQAFYAALPAVLIALLLVLAERMAGAPKTDWWRNLQAWALYFAVGLALPSIIASHGGAALLHGADMPFWLSFPLFLLLHDLGEYAYHRAQHRVPFLWAMHSLHHSDPEMSALTTQRHFWGDPILKALTIWPLASLIIAPTPGMVAAASAASLWNFVTHARLRIDLGRWSWLINSPAYHRRHHSMLPEHHDSNFAALFPIFDVIFGSYHRPDGFPPTGLAHKPETLGDLITWPLHQGDHAPARLTSRRG